MICTPLTTNAGIQELITATLIACSMLSVLNCQCARLCEFETVIVDPVVAAGRVGLAISIRSVWPSMRTTGQLS